MSNRLRRRWKRWRFAVHNVRAAWRCRCYDPDLARYFIKTAKANIR